MLLELVERVTVSIILGPGIGVLKIKELGRAFKLNLQVHYLTISYLLLLFSVHKGSIIEEFGFLLIPTEGREPYSTKIGRLRYKISSKHRPTDLPLFLESLGDNRPSQTVKPTHSHTSRRTLRYPTDLV